LYSPLAEEIITEGFTFLNILLKDNDVAEFKSQ
jgi:hypothetical protein